MVSGLNAANIIGEIMEAVGFTALADWLVGLHRCVVVPGSIKVDGGDIKPAKSGRVIKMKVTSA